MSASNADKKEPAGAAILISLSEIAEKADCEKLLLAIKAAGPEQGKKIILDLKLTKQISDGFIAEFTQLSEKLKAESKEVLSINVGADIKQQLIAKGISALFNSVAKTAAPETPSPVKTKSNYKLDAELINPFIEGVVITFKSLLKIDLKAEKPKLKDRKNPRLCEIAGLINLQSEGFNFSIAICFSSEVFLKVYDALVKEKHEKLSSEIEDGAAEILNIVYGHAKSTLKEKGYPLVMAIPTVITGEKISMLCSGPGPTLELIFNSPLGPFHLEIHFEADA